jgi:hypothetical protein
MTRRVLIAVGALLTAGLIGPAGAATTSLVPTTPDAATVVARISPVDSDGALAAGYTIKHRYGDANCESGSPTVGKAYQCFTPKAPQGIFDSCWVAANQHFVVCLTQPWQHKVARLHVTRGFGDSSGFLKVHKPWGMRVGAGLRCRVILDPTDTTRGQYVDYACNHKTALAGPIRRGSTWAVHAYRKVHHGGHHLTYRSLGMQPVVTAWFGLPSQKD